MSNKSNVVFDPIYGFIKLTPMEWDIIHSPFYQRLRWIRQLGFSSYVFPGAEHSRFGHSIGVMFNSHQILTSCGRAVSDEELMDPKTLGKKALFHKSLRVAALMHDLGTFLFSHTTEAAYIRFGETTNTKNGKGLKDDHENLGSFIIKNTNYDGGITKILLDYGLDPQNISDLVKGVDPSILANQILHSEIDCDRMDYLLRDAHYTGLGYGSYDRDYLLHHFQVMSIDQKDILTIRDNALHCVEDFLMSRFAWYSQVIRSSRGAKYDAIAERVCFYLLEKGFAHKYSDLLDMIANDPMKFYGFNDSYFMNLTLELLSNGSFNKDPDIKDMAKALLLGKGARSIRCKELTPRLLNQDNPQEAEKYYKKALAKAQELEDFVAANGEAHHWIIPDIPTKDIIFVRSPKAIVRSSSNLNNVLLERDPVKISYDDGTIKLLAEVENSVISRLHNTKNFIPNIFCSELTYELLVAKGMIEEN